MFLRRISRADIAGAAADYLDAAERVVVERFVSGTEALLPRAATCPAAGSARYAAPLNRPGLRFWPLKGYRYLILYLARGGWLDVWRGLPATHDLRTWLRKE